MYQLSQEQLQSLQLQWEQGGINTGRERYASQFKQRLDPWSGATRNRKTEADMKPGQAMIVRAVEPVAQAVLDWYGHLMSGKANRSADVAAVFAQLFETPDEDLDAEGRQAYRKTQAMTLSYLALKATFGQIGESKTAACKAIQQVVKDQMELTLAGRKVDVEASAESGKTVLLERRLSGVAQALSKKTSNVGHKHKAITVLKNKHAKEVKAWDASEGRNFKIGFELLGFVIGVTGWFEIQERLASRLRDGKPATVTEHYLEATEQIQQLLEQSHEFAAMLVPQIKPMLCKPRPWTSVFEGGFLNDSISRRFQFVKLANATVLQDIDSQRDEDGEHGLSAVFEAANLLQDTGFKINSRVLETMKAIWEQGGDVGDIPLREPMPLPERPCAAEDVVTFKTRNPEAWSKFIEERKEVYEFNCHPRRLGDKLGLVRTLTLAEELQGFDTPFHFVYTSDFRGRFYACSPELNPQGSDIHKSLLVFAEGKPLNERSAMWVAIHGANSWDVKAKDDPWLKARYPDDLERSLGKTTYDDRYQWVLDHESIILQVSKDPLSCDWWQQAETPFQFLAFCFEWAAYREHGEGYMAHLPVAADGACNALQWWSGLLRDETTAPKVNLVPTDKPGDIYGDVAVFVKRAIEELVRTSEGSEQALAQFWNGRISRGLVKQPVMTKAYGSTALGHRRMMNKKLKDDKKGDKDYKDADKNFQKTAMSLLTKVVSEGIRKEVKAASVGMDWAQLVAGHVTAAGIPLNWKTPDGFIVWQGYPKMKSERIETYLSGTVLVPQRSFEHHVDEATGEYVTDISTDKLVSAKKGSRVITTLQRETGELNVAKNRSAVAPNLIHALDGCMMRVVVREVFKRGGTAMMTVHDSYATHAADYELMQEVTREVFYTLLSRDLLSEWLAEVTAQMTDEERAKLDGALSEKFNGQLPPMGTLDLEDILRSDYIFA